MKKEEAIKIAKDFLYDAKLLVTIEPTEEDVQALDLLIHEVEKNSSSEINEKNIRR